MPTYKYRELRFRTPQLHQALHFFLLAIFDERYPCIFVNENKRGGIIFLGRKYQEREGRGQKPKKKELRAEVHAR
jgi:hypothetical protein